MLCISLILLNKQIENRFLLESTFFFRLNIHKFIIVQRIVQILYIHFIFDKIQYVPTSVHFASNFKNVLSFSDTKYSKIL